MCFIVQDHAETKAQLEKVKKDLAETKKESHKRKKLLMAQQQLIHAGSGSYNKVELEQLRNKITEIVFLQPIFSCKWIPTYLIPGTHVHVMVVISVSILP